MALNKYRCVTVPGGLGMSDYTVAFLRSLRRADRTQQHSMMLRLCQCYCSFWCACALHNPLESICPVAPQGLLGSSLHGLCGPLKDGAHCSCAVGRLPLHPWCLQVWEGSGVVSHGLVEARGVLRVELGC